MRLIDADALHKAYMELRNFKQDPQSGDWISLKAVPLTTVVRMLNDAPSIDIVRCKECKHRESCCRPCYKSADSYCSDGEREDEPQTCEECEHWNDTEDGCADRHGCKTENSSEKPNNCETCRHWEADTAFCYSRADSDDHSCHYEPQTERSE